VVDPDRTVLDRGRDRPAGVLAAFPDPPPAELVRFFDLEGYRWKSVSADAVDQPPTDGGGRTLWDGAVVVVDEEIGLDTVWRFCGHIRTSETPVLLLVGGGRLDVLTDRHDYFDDFVVHPFNPHELAARLALLLARAGKTDRSDLISYGPLALNIETYQAVLDGRHLDLTYMEYELLRFLASNPGQVFTRETLLNRVWGYEYYGGARTVDVHVRRLRAKMGQDYSSLISTIRGVGYRLGQSRWQS